LIDLQIVIL